MKTDISVFPWANIGQNDHSNPYIESTTVLSDKTPFLFILISFIASEVRLDKGHTVTIYIFIYNYIRVICRALNVLRASFSLIF